MPKSKEKDKGCDNCQELKCPIRRLSPEKRAAATDVSKLPAGCKLVLHDDYFSTVTPQFPPYL
ncbi:hypothetical protein A2872_03145 [Candidatus Gottesmanbacteria bacterium RIFCSPHIGHO2_01_FULL_42_12]|uniref:Uncharacterized protein n=1 Tax=Candidatus Gottesmanbacteria bacterium RIFCSPHIGHO2_01_FULL_42_12 TaxID=1798377 RepID=A0A1F5Z0Y0_9BACT|nr:MAG: hypothetical protein A2872_03145 [Candidatus Gottesmanbacteria bacterium RIFCSPHIGHO2_01_FULL_42_12]